MLLRVCAAQGAIAARTTWEALFDIQWPKTVAIDRGAPAFKKARVF